MTVSIMFCAGNDNLHDITASKRYELRFDIEDFNNVTKYAKYTYFTVASECDKYRIAFGVYNGTAGNILMHAQIVLLQQLYFNVELDFNVTIQVRGNIYHCNPKRICILHMLFYPRGFDSQMRFSFIY